MLRFPLNSKVRFHFLKIHTYLVLFHDVSKTKMVITGAICVEKTNSCKTHNFRTFLYDKTDAKYSILKFWWSTTAILPSDEFLVSRRDLVIGKFKSSFFSTADKLSPESGKRKILFSCQQLLKLIGPFVFKLYLFFSWGNILWNTDQMKFPEVIIIQETH